MKKYIGFIIVLIFSVFLISCRRELENDKTNYELVKITHEVSKFDKMDGKNEVYTRVEVTEDFYINPKKVVTFSLGVADTFNVLNLDEIGVEVFGLPKDQTTLPNLIKEFNDKKYYDVGTLFEPDFNMIELINPDLIILDGRTAKFYDKIKKDYPYINVLDASLTTYSLLEQEKVFNNLGKIFTKANIKLNEQIEIFKEKFELIQNLSNNYNAMFLQLNGKLISAATNKNGRYGLLYNEFGFKFKEISGVSLENSHGTAEISKESIREVNPDVIFIMDRNMITEGLASDQSFLKEELLSNVNAIKNGHVYNLNPKSWYTITGGLSATNQMIEDVMNFISNIS